MMKSTIILVSAATVFTVIQIARADDDLPKRANFDRYKAMLDHSPFAVASAVIEPTTTANWAKDLYIANAAKSPDGDMVTLESSSDKQFKKYLTTKEPADGYSIVNIEWSDRVGETRVTINKDGQVSTLSFNQALITSPLPRQPGGVGLQPVVPPRPQVNPATKIPLPPGGQTPQPRTRGLIQRNPGANQNAMPAAAQPAGAEQ